ncbi:DJ-1/PfpI family protein [Pyrococcus yayanosii]
MRVLFLSADQFEDVELIYPLHRLKEDGHEVYVPVKASSFRAGLQYS